MKGILIDIESGDLLLEPERSRYQAYFDVWQ